MFYVIAIAPAVVTLLLIAAWALKVGKHHFAYAFAVLGCLMPAATPWFAIWYAWYVLNDHTANIGAGLLAIGQPLLAPLGAVLGALLGMVVDAAVRRHGGR